MSAAAENMWLKFSNTEIFHVYDKRNDIILDSTPENIEYVKTDIVLDPLNKKQRYFFLLGDLSVNEEIAMYPLLSTDVALQNISRWIENDPTLTEEETPTWFWYQHKPLFEEEAI